MKILFFIAVGMVGLIYISKPTVNFYPFKLSFGAPYDFFGMFFLILALVCFGIHNEKIGYRSGFKDGINEAIEVIKKIKTNK